ncbi:Protein TRM32 [Linum perenne]
MAFMNKEFMATILQDPHSHFSPQFTSNKRYSKSTSFPSSTALINSSVKEPPQKIQGTGQSKEAEKIAPKELHNPLLLNSMSYARSRSLSTISAEKKMDGISPQLKQSVAPSSPTMGKGNIGRNKFPMKRLKYLKQKIRHVITMEAVLHKIPRGNAGSPIVSDLSNDKKEGGNDILLMSPMKSYADDYCKFVLSSNTENQRLKRTSSLFESLDKYCQLYESTFNRDSKKNIKVEDEPTTRTSLSLEKTHVNDEQIAGANDDDQTTTLCSEKSPIIGEPMESCTETKEASSSSTSDDVCGEENKHTSPQNKTPLYKFPVEESNDKLFDDASIFTHEHTASSLPSLSNFKDSEQILRNLIANKLNFLEDHRAESIIDDIIEAEEELDKNNEFQSKLNQTLYCSEVREYEVDCKDKEKFDYVKGILDISGFSRKELLGAWHSNDQPLDPAVFSEAAGGEHDDNNEHLPMFDLINELLMEIYAKSHTYCPKPLSWLSHIKLMPIGSRVLKEVWGNVKWSLNSAQDHHHLENDHHLLDFLVGRDFEKSDGWMNLQFDCECVGLELEDWIFDDILDELVFEDDPRGSIFY